MANNKLASLKIVEKLISDLEILVKSLINQQQALNEDSESENPTSIRDDSYELQKFCAKLEFLIQFNLKDRKGGGGPLLSSPSGGSGPSGHHGEIIAHTTTRNEYWSLLQDVFKASRSFEDAIKYVKSLNEIKSSLGKGRVFLRFCLQYHRLADAIQQLTMDDRVVRLLGLYFIFFLSTVFYPSISIDVLYGP